MCVTLGLQFNHITHMLFSTDTDMFMEQSHIDLTTFPDLCDLTVRVDPQSADMADDKIISDALVSTLRPWLQSTNLQHIKMEVDLWQKLTRSRFLSILALISATVEALGVAWQGSSQGSDTGSPTAHRKTHVDISVVVHIRDTVSMKEWWNGKTRKFFPGFRALDRFQVEYRPGV